LRLAAIDIGSNAARLLIQEVSYAKNEIPVFTKLNLLRIPLRLGFDVFAKGCIGADRRASLEKTMQVFQWVMDIYKVDHYRACATSAMRDANNGNEIIEAIKIKTGLVIEIITGSEEAQIIYENHLNAKINHKEDFLYIDVGGGSTEVTLMKKDTIVFKESFNIGTIRLLNEQITTKQWNAMKNAIKDNTKGIATLKAIGSGGNINKVFSLSKTKENKPLTLLELQTVYKSLATMTVAERINHFQLKEDRADVIVPALKVYTNIMKWANINEILVPKIGVADGIIKLLYAKHTAS
jgi:exopolyphosphatase/guanosine-5'-triphosphate,3'-diphosphate pyrophosphatase